MAFNVGIIGFGRIGAEHAGWLAGARGIRAVCVFDPTPERRALAASRGLRAVDSLDGIYGDPDIHAVLVSTPTAMHFDHAFLALMNRRPVMVEKPMALSLHEAEQLIRASKHSGMILTVFHNRRWDVDYLTVKNAITSGCFGKIINIESRIHQWASCVGPAAKEYHPNWHEASFGGGGLYDWGSHLIDQIWRLMLPAKPVSVFAQLRGNVWSKDCDDFARVCINFDNGAVGMVEINTTTTHPLPRWRIDGTLGSAQAPSSPTYDTREWAQLEFAPADGKPNSLCPLASPGLSESDIWTQFAAAIRENAQPAVSAESVLPTMCLLDAARRSSDARTAVDVRDSVDWNK